jgi:phosphohistidine phosphatase
MQLLIIRHAIAEDRAEFAEKSQGTPDSERPLTEYGRRRMRKNATGLRRISPLPDLIATSPYERAADTARIVAETLEVKEVEVVPTLTPEHRPADLLPWLSRQNGEATIALVGHEPHLGILITWFVGGREAPNAELKKGGACLLQVDRLEPGTALMRWLVTPAQLRAIAD